MGRALMFHVAPPSAVVATEVPSNPGATVQPRWRSKNLRYPNVPGTGDGLWVQVRPAFLVSLRWSWASLSIQDIQPRSRSLNEKPNSEPPEITSPTNGNSVQERPPSVV